MKNGTVQTAVMGVSGYAGMELVRLLLHHPQLARPNTTLFRPRRIYATECCS